MTKLPAASAYLDPLFGLETCFYYAIPKFHPIDHPNTRWLLSMIRANDVDRIRRKMELKPDTFKTGYFQLLDYPKLYHCADPNTTSLFHRQAVIYLSMLGMAMYLRSVELVRMVLEYRDPTGDALYSLKNPQYATHVLDTVNGDFHAYPLSVIMLRSGCYDYVPNMLAQKWDPLERICMPSRRRYERRAYYFLDWLDYCLWLMHERPLLPLARLVFNLTLTTALYKFQQMPISILLPASEEDRIYTGLVEVDSLPVDAKMIGAKSLLEIAEDYSVYQQTKERYHEIRQCITQMVADGYNPQIVMAQAQDFDGGALNENANNNAAAAAAAAKKRKGGVRELVPYASEATRVLLHTVKLGEKNTNKTPLNPMLDTIEVYIKRDLFKTIPISRKKKSDGAPPDAAKSHKKLLGFQKRDARNATILLLNIMQQQFDKISHLNQLQRDAKNRKHKHIDISRQTNNKRVLITRNVKRLTNVLFQVLLHSRQIVSFLEAEFPPYTYGEADFQLNPQLQNNFSDIQMGLKVELSQSLKAPSYMTLNEKSKASDIAAVFLNMRLGKAPKINPLDVLKNNKNPDARKKSNNASNIHLSSNAYHQKFPLLALDGHYMLHSDPISPQLGEAFKHGHVSFVRVKRRRKSPNAAKESSEDEAPELQLITSDQGQAGECGLGQNHSQSELQQPGVIDEVAKQLTEQIAQLRQRSAAEGNVADAALADIYSRILDDLKNRAQAQATTIATLSTDEAALETITSVDEQNEEVPESSEVNNSNSKVEQTLEATVSIAAPANQRIPSGRPVFGKRRFSKKLSMVRRPKCYQMVRVFDTPLEGTEFV